MGAGWTPEILAFDNALRTLTYQLIIWTLLLIHKSFWAFASMQLFWWTCTQDLIGFYGVWGAGTFPKGDWSWMPLYPFFGAWTTQMQLVLSCGSLFLLSVAYMVYWKFSVRWK